MSLFNKTENFSISIKVFTNEADFYSVLSKIPKYIMSFGIVGNLISLFVFSRPCLNQKTKSGRIYALLCCLSLIIIVYNLAGRKLDSFFEFKITLPRNTQYFIDMILLQFWSWIQVLITFDRFISVYYPIKGVRMMSKKWLLYSIIIGMFIFIIGVNSPNYIRCSTYMVGNVTYKANDMMCDDVVVLTYIVKILMQFVIPYFLMVILDVMVIIRLRKSKNRLASAKRSTRISRSLRFSRNTILIDFIYLFFNFPPVIYNVYSILLFIYPEISFSNSFFNILPMFVDIFPYVYPSILFLVFVTFNRIFRSELFSLFRLDKCFKIITNSFVLDKQF